MNLEFLQSVALSVANERSAKVVLRKIVEGLASEPNVALARIWLTAAGDICQNCSREEECRVKNRCLHLVASDGHSIQPGKVRLNRLDGNYRRFPLSTQQASSMEATGKVGFIGGTGKAVLLNDVAEHPKWLRDPEWSRREKITSFAGQPLMFRSEIVGVLAIFSRAVLSSNHLATLRAFSDNAAAAIANARAFEEIEQLHQKLELENEYLRGEVREVHAFGDIVGQGSALQKTLQQIELVAPTDTSVLILGESGAGKELIALAIHERSRRKNRSMIKVNCASIPKELFESEFFGHVKGAFTGALKDRTGRFQLADGGTLFLDEVGDIPVELQSKLLRVLQEGEFERIGEDKTRRVDVRIISATNRDLKKEVEAKRFRRDLYFRLSVFPVEVAPLRNRVEDIPLLAEHFLKQACRRLGMPALPLKQKHVLQLQGYNWPGNIRELQNVLERAVIKSGGGALQLDLPEVATEEAVTWMPKVETANNNHEIRTYEQWKEMEKANILAALRQTHWKVAGPGGAAELLGTKPTTLASRIKALGIEK